MQLLAMNAALIVSSLFAVPRPVPKENLNIVGVWEVVERHVNGEREDTSAPMRWTISRKSLVIERRDEADFRQVEGVTYRLVKPKDGKANEIDLELRNSEDDARPKILLSRFELNGDTLRICTSRSPDQDRPATCKPSPGTNLFVFTRVKDKKSE